MNNLAKVFTPYRQLEKHQQLKRSLIERHIFCVAAMLLFRTQVLQQQSHWFNSSTQ
ncbi:MULTISPECIES: hypothetical protein [Prochlorococcus]|uniref:hypothetical protein n=1 Tax=Prochlorococcus TaxID=1218 RepID=UPI000A8B7411|nr:hypothetical protein [Prochlorococcus marinus]